MVLSKSRPRRMSYPLCCRRRKNKFRVCLAFLGELVLGWNRTKASPRREITHDNPFLQRLRFGGGDDLLHLARLLLESFSAAKTGTARTRGLHALGHGQRRRLVRYRKLFICVVRDPGKIGLDWHRSSTASSTETEVFIV